MTRTIRVGETDSLARRVYFDVLALDNYSPALFEAGGQPEVSVNGASFNSTGISVLTAIGFGKYYATLETSIITTIGDILLTRYKSGSTLETPGDTFQVIDSTSKEADPTSGLVSTSSYAIIAEANIYFANRLRSQSWTNASVNDKTIALRQATRLIDRLNFAGEKANEEQILQFPRKNVFQITEEEIETTQDYLIPTDIKCACYEIAIRLLEGYDPDMQVEAVRIVNHRMGQAGTQYDPKFTQEHIVAGIPSATAWSYLKPYLRSSANIQVMRV